MEKEVNMFINMKNVSMAAISSMYIVCRNNYFLTVRHLKSKKFPLLRDRLKINPFFKCLLFLNVRLVPLLPLCRMIKVRGLLLVEGSYGK